MVRPHFLQVKTVCFTFILYRNTAHVCKTYF